MNFVTRRYAPYNKLHQADTASRLRLLFREQSLRLPSLVAGAAYLAGRYIQLSHTNVR